MSLSTFDPNNAQNLEEIEKQFAVKAVEHAQTYWDLLEKVKPGELRLTALDDEIYTHTMSAFPELKDPEKLAKIDEEWMKSPEGKKRWHQFIESYKGRVKDYNFGCLIRTDVKEEYGETNTVFATRMQFYAYEIARNRLRLNDNVYKERTHAANGGRSALRMERHGEL